MPHRLLCGIFFCAGIAAVETLNLWDVLCIKMHVAMRYNPHKHHRRSIRLEGYDYALPGLYFLTICCNGRACLFGAVTDGKMILNEPGKIADKYWNEIPDHFPDAILYEYVVMPNHIHGIIELTTNPAVGANKYSPYNVNHHFPGNMEMLGSRANDYSPLRDGSILFRSPSRTIGSIVRGYKIGMIKWFRQNMADDFPGSVPVWQRNYHEHIIRDEVSYNRIADYIINNPARWAEDRFYVL